MTSAESYNQVNSKLAFSPYANVVLANLNVTENICYHLCIQAISHTNVSLMHNIAATFLPTLHILCQEAVFSVSVCAVIF